MYTKYRKPPLLAAEGTAKYQNLQPTTCSANKYLKITKSRYVAAKSTIKYNNLPRVMAKCTLEYPNIRYISLVEDIKDACFDLSEE